MVAILCINRGSSSLKYALYEMGEEEHLIMQGEVDSIFTLIKEKELSFDVVAHRIVHGGKDHVKAEKVTGVLLEKLKNLAPFAPLHLPLEIALIEGIQEHFPNLPQFVCFDTAFHRKMPMRSQHFPLPEELFDAGILRYGFHGLSYEYILTALPKEDQEKLIIAHLGNGASLAAIKEGKPLETTMGFTPTGGVMMGSRSGDLDPGILLYLQEVMGYDARKLSQLFNEQSGLLGVSGISSDMKVLLEAREKKAEFAIDLFCQSVRKAIGAFATSLGGLKTLVFTAGIGEKAAVVRERICSGISFLGIELDKASNEKHDRIISKGKCRVLVIPTNEDLMIARHIFQLLEGSHGTF